MTDELYNILMDPERLERQIERKRWEIEAIEASVYPAGIRYDRDKVQTSPRDDQIPSVLAKTEPLQKDLDRLTKRYQKWIKLIRRPRTLSWLSLQGIVTGTSWSASFTIPAASWGGFTAVD